MHGDTLRILQLTDCHLGGDSGESLLGLNTAATLNDVLGRIAVEHKAFDLIVNTGDTSNDGSIASYERFLSAARHKFPGAKLAWLPGNHDDPTSMKAVKERPFCDYLRLGSWNLILLNSRVPFEERGELSPAELHRLEGLLQSDPQSPTLIFLHHQLVPVGSAWIDQYVVGNASEFFTIIDRFDNIKAVSWGHVHQEFFTVRNGVDLLATPSTCVQFKPLSDDFLVDTIMPGYRIYKLQTSGVYQTSVGRVARKSYNIDFASSGY